MKVPTTAPVPAEDLYLGQHHVRLMRGVRCLRAAGTEVDVWIVSAQHGVVHGREPLLTYEQTFQGRPAAERRDMATRLGIPKSTRAVLRRPAALALVLLGEDYLDACQLTDDVSAGAQTLLFCAASVAVAMPSMPDVKTVALRTE